MDDDVGGSVADAASAAEAWAAEVEAAWEWLEASAGREWASADEADNDAGPTVSDLRGEVDHG